MVRLGEQDFRRILDEHSPGSASGDVEQLDEVDTPRGASNPKAAFGIRMRRFAYRWLGRARRASHWPRIPNFWIPKTAPLLDLRRNPGPLDDDLDIAVHIHAYFLDVLPEILAYTQNIDRPFTCYLTTDTKEKASAAEALLRAHPLLRAHRVLVTPNIGRDIAPWLRAVGPYNNDHELWCHLHSKKSTHSSGLGDRWRRFLLETLLGDPDTTRSIFRAFVDEPELGLVMPPFFWSAVEPNVNDWDDPERAREFLFSIGVNAAPPKHPVFSAGSMCWYRPQALGKLFSRDWSDSDFEPETGQIGMTVMHLIERSLVYVSASEGLDYRMIRPRTNP